jgi:hypothetical protein
MALKPGYFEKTASPVGLRRRFHQQACFVGLRHHGKPFHGFHLSINTAISESLKARSRCQ